MPVAMISVGVTVGIILFIVVLFALVLVAVYLYLRSDRTRLVPAWLRARASDDADALPPPHDFGRTRGVHEKWNTLASCDGSLPPPSGTQSVNGTPRMTEMSLDSAAASIPPLELNRRLPAPPLPRLEPNRRKPSLGSVMLVNNSYSQPQPQSQPQPPHDNDAPLPPLPPKPQRPHLDLSSEMEPVRPPPAIPTLSVPRPGSRRVSHLSAASTALADMPLLRPAPHAHMRPALPLTSAEVDSHRARALARLDAVVSAPPPRPPRSDARPASPRRPH